MRKRDRAKDIREKESESEREREVKNVSLNTCANPQIAVLDGCENGDIFLPK